ncbi:MAG: hypothetical protein GF398_04140 [Chitinivibrionales bacterium]|nr:hypothetical protein [Chitinivibrionales bacterium]
MNKWMLFLAIFATSISLSAKISRLSAGDTLFGYSWYQKDLSRKEIYYNNDAVIVDSVDTTTGTSSITFKIDADKHWLTRVLFKNTVTISVFISETKPSQVVDCSKKFDTMAWIYRAIVTINSKEYVTRFCLPLLDSNEIFDANDFFECRLNSSMKLRVVAEDRNCLLGTFYHMTNGIVDSMATGNWFCMDIDSKLSPLGITYLYGSEGEHKLISQYLQFSQAGFSDHSMFGFKFSSFAKKKHTTKAKKPAMLTLDKLEELKFDMYNLAGRKIGTYSRAVEQHIAAKMVIFRNEYKTLKKLLLR